jgi:hypothetical protein
MTITKMRFWQGARALNEEPRFLMTPAQHRQWAQNARRLNRPDFALPGFRGLATTPKALLQSKVTYRRVSQRNPLN